MPIPRKATANQARKGYEDARDIRDLHASAEEPNRELVHAMSQTMHRLRRAARGDDDVRAYVVGAHDDGEPIVSVMIANPEADASRGVLLGSLSHIPECREYGETVRETNERLQALLVDEDDADDADDVYENDDTEPEG